MPRDYKTPEAFRQSLESRLREQAQSKGLPLDWLRRQVAFERFLARMVQPEPVWLLKGGYAVELRLEHQTRTTLDIDLAVPDIDTLRLAAGAAPNEHTLGVSLDYLQLLAEIDLEDFFSFIVTKSRELMTPVEGGLRCAVECRIGGRRFANFRVDVGLGDPVLKQPEWVCGRDLLAFAGIDAFEIPLLPTAQQIAEKFHAYTYPWDDRTNSRTKDLIDLILLFENQPPDHGDLRAAIKATFSYRDTHPIPEQLPPPPEVWAETFFAEAARFNLPVKTLTEALDYLQERWRIQNS